MLAGPGSGKTRLLTERVRWLLGQGVPADDIAVLTFSTKAAGEIRERLSAPLSDSVKLPTCSTFHALAGRLMQESDPSVRLLSGTEEDALLMRAARSLEPDISAAVAREALRRIHFFRVRAEDPGSGFRRGILDR